MTTANDPRTAALLTLVSQPQQSLVAAVLRGLDQLEQTDFGELEPVGVAAPTGGR